VAGGLDVDKTDLKRWSDFVHRKAYDLLLMSQAAAKFNLRDVMESWDLPITKGLQESIHGFTKLDEQIELEPILEGIAAAAARSRVRRRDPFEATVIRISTIPRRSTGRPPSGCSICCSESDISKSEGHRLKGDFSD
jgi:hypothetical protein